MRVLYLINGLGFSLNTGIGGSDKRAVEIIRNLKKQHPDGQFDILTTTSGKNLFEDTEDLQTTYHTIKQPFWWPSKLSASLFGRVLSYFYATFMSLLWTRKMSNYDIYFATSDFFFDVFPAYFYKVFHKKKLVCMIHHHIKDPFERGGSKIINAFMFVSQFFSFTLIKMITNTLFLYDTAEGRKIHNMLFKSKQPRIKTYFVKNGINEVLIDQAKQKDKQYEACFLGGLRHSKGIQEFVPIWKEVLVKFPHARFLVIGGGSKELVSSLEKEIYEAGLDKNIILTGPLSGTKLFEQLKMSKIFLFPSHEEGWGIALCEAMYCGLPVVCYDLPAFKTFGSEIDVFKVGDHKALANKVVEYLQNPEKIKNKGSKLKTIAEKYTWNSIAMEDYMAFSEILKT